MNIKININAQELLSMPKKTGSMSKAGYLQHKIDAKYDTHGRQRATKHHTILVSQLYNPQNMARWPHNRHIDVLVHPPQVRLQLSYKL
jgi:hypothetical protein